ncbi:MAG: hypothetical protein A3H70_04630 [Candidatus Komeilibacteria bacterium RIFCSPLOWO2_02_FULL_48_11]|uniref:Uncharacterized protein n=1 Tax=Candidatus Komeilibacteria bacterium RIFCSPLOWO2_02_FULL_48_11 TaxID=1798553 RepID=A0A1G2BW25_9BACT|nr:MAG: hypothetical protein A3H70_04630 [Candidatus Komeilibacteria bacterium RIFCSPLOWO2_02_FULL_48_11]
MRKILLDLNKEIFHVSVVLTLALFTLETLKEGFVTFYFNPVWILLVFLLSGAVWLFTPDKT